MVTTDKSKNHRANNQITMICTVVNGEGQGIPLNVLPVYFTSDGATGTAVDFAGMVISDVKTCALSDSTSILQMQGKLTDGQYLLGAFGNTINQEIFDHITLYERETSQELKAAKDEFWWSWQWDPGHWLDKVFSKFKNTVCVDRILKRTGLYHQMFGHGKMHIVAKQTAKELSLKFNVTNTFAQQRFMSSSYLSLKTLQKVWRPI